MIRKGFVLVVLLALVVTGVTLAQDKKAQQEVQKFKSSAEQTVKSVEKARGTLQQTLDLYNSIVNGEAKNVESSYKKLTQNTKEIEKASTSIRKQIDTMSKNAEKLFAGWEEQIGQFTSENLKATSQQQLDDAKQRYKAIKDSAAGAKEIYDPFIANLNEQIMFMGRNLSPDALAALGDEATKLNEQATALMEQVDGFLEVAHENQQAMATGGKK